MLQKDGKITTTTGLSMQIPDIPGGENFVGDKGEEGLMFALQVSGDPDSLYITFTTRGPGIETESVDMILGELNLRTQSIRRILSLSYPKNNHHSGALVYGQSGALYMGSGDGGSQGDPNNYGQMDNTHLGKILRINPTDGSYSIIAKGVRNPWTISTARNGQDLFVADVGWNTAESIYYLRDFESSDKIFNLGWSKYEGSIVIKPGQSPRWADTAHPIFEYPTSKEYGRCIIGGFWEPNLGSYIYADLTGIMKAITPFAKGEKLVQSLDEVTNDTIWLETGFQRVREPGNPEYKSGDWWIHSISRSADGKLYIAGSNGVYSLQPKKN
jgi:hypothetical protein